jgi:hypothetical protein
MTASKTWSVSASDVRQLPNATRSACVPAQTVGVMKASPDAAISRAGAWTRS